MKKYIVEFKYWITFILLTCISLLWVTFLYKETLLFSTIYSTKFPYFIFTDAREILEVYLKIIQSISFYTLLYFGVYHAFQFLIPAFYKKEFLTFKLTVALFLVVLPIGSAFSVFFLIPLMWDFLLSFQNFKITQSLNVFFEAKLKDYIFFSISFYEFSTFWLQFFFAFILVIKHLVVDLTTIKSLRKPHYYSVVLFLSFIAPSEISLFFLSFIFVLYYELLILFFIWKASIKNILIDQQIKTNQNT